MTYDERNKNNLDKLGDNTKKVAYKWYNHIKEHCEKNGVDILIYETIRSLEAQKENVRKGVSKTLLSYHLVGQALDWVLVDKDGKALWNAYYTPNATHVINEAKKLGFESGRDWGWDAPHLQYKYRGYGTDTFGKKTTETKKENGVEDLEFTSSTLKGNLLARLSSPTTMRLIDEKAVKELGYKSKLVNNRLSDGDLLAMAIELAVHYAKKE